MDSRAKQVIEAGDKLFSKRLSLVSLWQEVADNFYPERADFTISRSLGTDFASHLMTSYPVLARRNLGNTIGTMMRPNQKDWFKTGTARETRDIDGKAWLERATLIQKRAMYDRRTQFVRATKEGDHDYAAFGQCAISVEMNRNLDGLLYRCWHLRDVAWCEGEDGTVEGVHRKWKPTAYALNALFPGKLHHAVTSKLEKDPYCEFNCRHVVIPADQYHGDKQWRTKFVSLYIDADNGHVMEEVGVKRMPYVIPRWQTVSGSQYAYSPATVCALPDARLIQSMTLVLLEAGEKAVTPPMVANKEVFRDDFSMYAGGLTWADLNGDQKIQDVFQVLSPDKSGLPMGMELRSETREAIMEAFYLNKINLPPVGGPNMTAFEVGQRVQEYIRQALPIFEPIESDYNGGLCEATFDLLMDHGAFGPPDAIPESLRGQDVKFTFESPLTEAIEKQKVSVFMEASSILAQAVPLDQSAAAIVDVRVALRDALNGAGVPAKWTRSDEQMDGIEAEAAAAQEQAALLGALEQSSGIAKTMAEAGALAQ